MNQQAEMNCRKQNQYRLNSVFIYENDAAIVQKFIEDIAYGKYAIADMDTMLANIYSKIENTSSSPLDGQRYELQIQLYVLINLVFFYNSVDRPSNLIEPICSLCGKLYYFGRAICVLPEAPNRDVGMSVMEFLSFCSKNVLPLLIGANGTVAGTCYESFLYEFVSGTPALRQNKLGGELNRLLDFAAYSGSYMKVKLLLTYGATLKTSHYDVIASLPLENVDSALLRLMKSRFPDYQPQRIPQEDGMMHNSVSGGNEPLPYLASEYMNQHNKTHLQKCLNMFLKRGYHHES